MTTGMALMLVAAVLSLSLYEHANGAVLTNVQAGFAKLNDARREAAETAENTDGCKWRRVWRADASGFSDIEVQTNNVRTNGSGFSIHVTPGSNLSTQVAFPLDSATFPSQGRLVLRAQFPAGHGLRPSLKFVKHTKELVVVEGTSTHPTSLIVHPGSPRPTSSTRQTNHLRLKDFPCFQEHSFTSSLHEFHLDWDVHWVRWYVDSVFYAEAPRSSSFLAADDVHPLSVVVAIEVGEPSNTTGSSPPEPVINDLSGRFVVQDLFLMEQTSSACIPTLTNPNDCRQYSMDKPAFLPQIRSGSLEGSMSLTQVYEFLNDVVPGQLAEVPHLYRTEVIGTSVEGRPIVALCLGACHAPSPPQALYTALHHSREPMSMMNLAFFIDHLILGLRGGDPTIAALLWSRQLWFVLVVNPDGYAFNEATMPTHPDVTFSGQRKNRHKSSKCHSAADIGVDLNRNYDVCFSQDAVGSSDEACAEDYRGPAPFSEPETRAIRDFVERQNFSTAFNYHSFGQYFNIPFACQPKGVPPPFAMSVFDALATDMTSRNRFKFGQSWKESNLYSVNGETSDWMWQAHGIFAMSPETGPSFDLGNFRGFWPSDPLVIHGICEELLHSNYILAQAAGPQYVLTMQGWSTVATDDGDIAAITLDLSVLNAGLRAPHQSVEIVASVNLNGNYSSPIYTLPPLLHAADPANDAVAFKMVVPTGKPSWSGHVYTVLRDGQTCSMYRISLGRPDKQEVFQVWQPLVLPQCGSCGTFGSIAHERASSKGVDTNCLALDESMLLVQSSPLRKYVVGSATSETDEDLPPDDDSGMETMRPTGAAPKPPNGAPDVAHHEKKALLLVSLIVLLGMVVVMMGLRHAKTKQSDDYAKVSKAENHDDGEELDNMLDLTSPKNESGAHESSLENGDGSPAHQRRVRSPQRDDQEGLLHEKPVSRRVRSPPPPTTRDNGGNNSHDEV